MHSVPGARLAPPAAAAPGRPSAKEQKDFEKMRQEVHLYGAPQLARNPRLPGSAYVPLKGATLATTPCLR